MMTPVSSSTQNPNPSPLSVSPDLNQSHFDSIISSLLTCPDSPSLSISSSIERVLHNLSSSSGDDSGSSIVLSNASPFFSNPPKVTSDLTIKVFSMLDTKSLMQASACCTMFNKCAIDPLCYSHIDLTTAFKHANDRILQTMIDRSGNELRSLKIGHDAPEHFSYLFTSSCLAPLKFYGKLLRSLHIYSLGFLYINSLMAPLSACSNLTDLKIVGVRSGLLEPILEILSRKCCLIEHLYLDSCYGGIITFSTIKLFVTNCLKLTSLTLLNFKIYDAIAQILIKGFHKLKYINLFNAVEIDGRFLRDLEHRFKDSPVETLILRDCFSLQEREVLEFLNSLIAGNFRSIRYIDVSSNKGLACDGDKRTSEPNFPLEKLKEERSNVTFVADFPIIQPRGNTKAPTTSSPSNPIQKEGEAQLHYEDQSTSSTAMLSGSRTSSQTMCGKSRAHTPHQIQLTNRFESLSDLA